MLKSIVLKNIQSHKKTVIKLVEGVNVIIGKSQAGKTAILRGLELLRTNRPSGDRIVRHGQKNAFVTARTTEGDKVTIKKTAKERIYKVNDSTFRKFGTAVPEEVTQALRMTDVNIQTQLSSPFLVTSTGSEITKTINRITKAEKVDAWVKTANKKVNELTREKTTTTGKIEEIKTQLKTLEDLPGIEEAVTKAKRLLNKENFAIRKWSDVGDLIEKLEKRESVLKRENARCRLYPSFESAMQIFNIVEKHNADLKVVNKFIAANSRLKTMTREIIGIDDNLAEYTAIAARIAGINETIELEIDVFIHNTGELLTATKEVDVLKEQYLEALQEEEVCPTCFGDMDSDAIERIEAEI